jgi:epoxyqueuosine reductase
MENPSLTPSERVKRRARALGFDVVGIARAGPGVRLDEDVARWDAFTAAGMHGEMPWLAEHRGARLRLDGAEVLEGARSVVCLARRYQLPSGEEPAEGALASTIARYARGRDYHVFLRRRVRRLAAYLRQLGTDEHPVRARPLCDEEPVLERAWAVRAGLGFIGKNGLLIVPGLGSMVLLGEVVTTLELAPDEPMNERCGTCTRCLSACPTNAFVAPRVLDARRCVSYLTIEHRSAVDRQLRAGVGEHLFGCDDCQTVCPFNAAPGARVGRAPDRIDPFAPLERWSGVELEDLLSLDEAAWRALAAGSPLKRAGRAGLARNAAIVLGNRGEARSLRALRACAETHDDEVVRETAAWAIAAIEGRRERH